MKGRSIAGRHQPDAITHDWITPKFIIDALGPFDLDPCQSVTQPWLCARAGIVHPADGLTEKWLGRVWCNPPYSTQAAAWLARMADHGSGTALIYARTETDMFFEHVWSKAHGILFLRGRVFFHRPDGERAPHNSGGPSCLISYSPYDSRRLRESGLEGRFLHLTSDQSSTHNTLSKPRREVMDFGPLSEMVDTPNLAKHILNTLNTTKERFPAESQAKNFLERLLEDTIAGAVQSSVLPQIEETLRETIDGFLLTEGDRPEDQVAAVAWDEKAGETIEILLDGDIAKAMGQGWIGENTIGPRFDNPDTITRIATEAARGVGRWVSDFSTAEALGLNTIELEGMATKLIGIPASLDRRKGNNTPKVDKNTRDKVVLSAVAGLLNNFAVHELIPELDLIGDFDEVLTPGAAERLGIKDSVVLEALKGSYADTAAKRTWAETIVKQAQNLSVAGSETDASTSASGLDQPATGAAAGEGASVAPPLPTDRPPTRRRTRNNSANSAAVVALQAMLRCASNQEMAQLLNCTKSTIGNYSTGKSPFVPTTYELEAMSGKAVQLRDHLNMAIEMLDAAALE